jgi:predicted PurR-regulated permease PerM
LRATINRRFPPQRQEYIDTITTITIEKVGGWTYSRAVLALASAGFHLVVFLVLGLPYGVALALWVGLVSQFVPTVGTYLAGVLPILVVLLVNPIDALWVLIAIGVYQQIENYLVAPRVTANTMDLHPAVGFASAIVGASLLGGIGALLALPVAATITALVQTYGDHYDLITSGTIENPEDYEARMQAQTEAKLSARAERSRRRPPRNQDQTPTRV